MLNQSDACGFIPGSQSGQARHLVQSPLASKTHSHGRLFALHQHATPASGLLIENRRPNSRPQPKMADNGRVCSGWAADAIIALRVCAMPASELRNAAMPDETADNTLLHKAVAGDGDALEALLLQYFDRLVADVR